MDSDRAQRHMALDALAVGIQTKKVNWLLDADIRGFFDTLNHEWLMKFVEHRIADPRVVRHIQKWLNAGVMEDGRRHGPSWAQAVTRCSQLSSTSISLLSPIRLVSVSIRERSGRSRTPRARPPPGAPGQGLKRAASSTSRTPPGYSRSNLTAISIASRVLPQPPAPVSVSSRVLASKCMASAISFFSPHKTSQLGRQVVIRSGG